MKYLVFDIGGTGVKYALADEKGALEGQGGFPTPAALEGMLAGMRRVCGALSERPAGVCLSSPGSVDVETGVVHGISAVPYIHGIVLPQAVSAALGGLPVSIENDANCAALGEYWLGAAQGAALVASVVCGTGVGGAVLKDGRVQRGAHLSAGEFGNLPVALDGQGNIDTWSHTTVVNLAREYSAATGQQADGRALIGLAQAGDARAKALLGRFFAATARGLMAIQFCLDPQLILFGGGVSRNPWVLRRIEQEVRALFEGKEYDYMRPQLSPCRFGNDANLLGALYHHLHWHADA